jgi:hypothetical protein
MSDRNDHKTNPNQPMIYQIRIKGHLGPQWKDWFDGMTMTLEENGETVLTGPVADQPALHGLLKKVRDLGMNLVAVNRIDSSQGGASEVKDEEDKSSDDVEEKNYKRSIEMRSNTFALEKNKMANATSTASRFNIGRIAGVLYLTIIISGIFAEFFVRQSLRVPGDAAATASNIMASESLFRLGIAADLVMIMSDIALALIFYVLLKKVNQSLSLLAAFFRLGQATILGLNLLNLFAVIQLLSGDSFLSTFEAGQLHSLAYLFFNAHGTGYSIAMVFFGFSILVLGYLIFKSGYIPKALGAMLMLASVGYLVDSFAKFLMADYTSYEGMFTMVVFVPAFISELALCLWLLIKGLKDQPEEVNLIEN